MVAGWTSSCPISIASRRRRESGSKRRPNHCPSPRRRREARLEAQWGEGSDSVAVFLDLSEEEERARLEAARAWQRLKFDAGYAMINWPESLGGRGLPTSYLRAYNGEERRFAVPLAGELPPTSMA